MIQQSLVINRIVFLLFCFIVSVLNVQAQVKGVEGKNGKWVLVNASGKMVTQTIYDGMGNYGQFSEGLAAVIINKKSGYIDTTGKVIIPLKYAECNKFSYGTATVWIGDFCGLIDKKGKLLIPIKYSLIEDSWDDTKVAVSIYNKSTERPKYGLFTRSGKQLLPVTYNSIEDMQKVGPVTTNQKPISVPSIESDVVPGVFTMKVPAALKQQSGDLYGHVSIYSNGSTFLYFKKDDNKNAISYLNAMLQFKQFKTRAGFIELGSINYSSPSKISFVGFYGVMPDRLNRKDMDTEEAYVFFSKPGESKECWVLHYLSGKESIVQIEKEIEHFLETVKLK